MKDNIIFNDSIYLAKNLKVIYHISTKVVWKNGGLFLGEYGTMLVREDIILTYYSDCILSNCVFSNSVKAWSKTLNQCTIQCRDCSATQC